MASNWVIYHTQTLIFFHGFLYSQKTPTCLPRGYLVLYADKVKHTFHLKLQGGEALAAITAASNYSWAGHASLRLHRIK